MKHSKSKGLRRHFSDAERQAIINEVQTGDASQASLAKKHGICKATLQNWLRAHRASQAKRKQQKLIPVRILGNLPCKNTPPSSDLIFEITLKSNRQLRFSTGFDPIEIRSLVKILEETC